MNGSTSNLTNLGARLPGNKQKLARSEQGTLHTIHASASVSQCIHSRGLHAIMPELLYYSCHGHSCRFSCQCTNDIQTVIYGGRLSHVFTQSFPVSCMHFAFFNSLNLLGEAATGLFQPLLGRVLYFQLISEPDILSTCPSKLQHDGFRCVIAKPTKA